MKNQMFQKIVDAIDNAMLLENGDREGVVYDSLAKDMARAARVVYDACLKGQDYDKNETERTTSDNG
jgi:hypothetical protein